MTPMIKAKHILRVKETREVAPTYSLLVLEARGLADAFLPGQFMHIGVCSEGGEEMLRRPISVLGLYPERDELTLIIKDLGPGSRWLCERRAGDELDCIGPIGNPFPIPENTAGGEFLLVGGGVGLAPLFTLAQRLSAEGANLTLYNGARMAEWLVLSEDFANLGCEVREATNDGSRGVKGYVTDLIDGGVDRFRAIYSCGPNPMFVALQARLEEFGWSGPCWASLESKMGCGIGVCRGCSVMVDGHPRRVCIDGPVFPLIEIDFAFAGL
jgi:dihydroorotate dehydrogenase electron transfer subunit